MRRPTRRVPVAIKSLNLEKVLHCCSLKSERPVSVIEAGRTHTTTTLRTDERCLRLRRTYRSPVRVTPSSNGSRICRSTGPDALRVLRAILLREKGAARQIRARQTGTGHRQEFRQGLPTVATRQFEEAHRMAMRSLGGARPQRRAAAANPRLGPLKPVASQSSADDQWIVRGIRIASSFARAGREPRANTMGQPRTRLAAAGPDQRRASRTGIQRRPTRPVPLGGAIPSSIVWRCGRS